MATLSGGEGCQLHGLRVEEKISLGVFLRFDEGLLGDEDAIKELTLILASDSADLHDLGADHGDSGVVSSIEDELTLDGLGDLDGGATNHVDELVLLATKEVLDGDAGTVLGDSDVDGEMVMHQPHLVAEALLRCKHSLV